jgi:hypothetical protein
MSRVGEIKADIHALTTVFQDKLLALSFSQYLLKQPQLIDLED